MDVKFVSFTQPLNIPISKDKYQLRGDFPVAIEVDKYDWYEVIVPRGYINDGASIPRIFWGLVGMRPDGLIRGPATFHDWCYDNNGSLVHSVRKLNNAKQCWERLPEFYIKKEDADKIFYMMMLKAGMSKLSSYLVYKAVSIFGRY